MTGHAITVTPGGWACECGYVCADAPDPEGVWVAHVAGVGSLVSHEDAAAWLESFVNLPLPCGDVYVTHPPTYADVAGVEDQLFGCPLHGVTWCHHANIDSQRRPVWCLSTCPAQPY